MTYELAKKLKDAGYPQDKMGYYANFHQQVTPLTDETARAGDQIKQPSLSELIAACGDGFYDIRHRGSEIDKGLEWVASTTHGMGKPPELGWGSTPEEAVANLWLELNATKLPGRGPEEQETKNDEARSD